MLLAALPFSHEKISLCLSSPETGNQEDDQKDNCGNRDQDSQKDEKKKEDNCRQQDHKKLAVPCCQIKMIAAFPEAAGAAFRI